MKTITQIAELLRQDPSDEILSLEGQTVTGWPLGWDEVLSPEEELDHDPYDGDTEMLSGVLSIEYNDADPEDPYWSYYIDGIAADPSTIDAAEEDPTENAFCPTGEGGGIDPSCSPAGGSKGGSAHGTTPIESEGDAKGRLRDIANASGLPKSAVASIAFTLKKVEVHDSPDALTAHLKSKYGTEVKDIHREATFDRREGILYVTKSSSHAAIAHEMGHMVDGPLEQQSRDPAFVRAWKKEASKVSEYAQSHPAEGLAELFRLRYEQGAKAVEKLAPAMTKALGPYWKGKKHPLTINEEDPLANVFCPTGPSGGVDPTCSPEGKKGGRGGRLTPPIATDLYRMMNETERSEAIKLEREGTQLNKKVKTGKATDVEKKRADDIRTRMAEIRKTARDRAAKKDGGSTTTKDGVKKEKGKKKDANKQDSVKQEEPKKEPKKKAEFVEPPREEQPKQMSSADYLKGMPDLDTPHVTTAKLEHVTALIDKHSTYVGSQLAHGMPEAENMRAINIDGKRWYFNPETTKRTMATTLADVLTAKHRGDIPDLVWQANEKILFTAARNKEDPYWEKTYGIKDFRSAATGGDGRMVVYNGASVGTGTFVHEGGHNVAARVYGSAHPDLKGLDAKNVEFRNKFMTGPEVTEKMVSGGHDWIEAKKKEPEAVTTYGKNSDAEDFAEASRIYANKSGKSSASRGDRAWLKDNFPLKYASMRKLYGD